MLWRESEHDVLAGEAWDESRARSAIAEIVADAERACIDGFWPAHDRDEVTGAPVCSLYLGSAGMLWGLMRLGSEIDAATIAERLLEVYRQTPDFEDDPDEGAHPASLFMGETGLIMTAARAGSGVSHLSRLRALIAQNRENPMRELLYGSAGTTLAARAAGIEECWRESAEWMVSEWDLKTDLWTQSFAGQEAQYLGAAHGFAGNVNALRGYVEDSVLRERVERLLTATAVREGDLANWAPTTRSPPEMIRVQWCHGAPGIVAMVGDLMPRELAEAAGELTWRAGPLRKGAGLCHGTAGNGYALLQLLAVTGDERWLTRARAFAMHALAQVAVERKRDGRGRYTLWTGDIGVALYASDCLRGEAALPTIDDLGLSRVDPRGDRHARHSQGSSCSDDPGTGRLRLSDERTR